MLGTLAITVVHTLVAQCQPATWCSCLAGCAAWVRPRNAIPGTPARLLTGFSLQDGTPSALKFCDTSLAALNLECDAARGAWLDATTLLLGLKSGQLLLVRLERKLGGGMELKVCNNSHSHLERVALARTLVPLTACPSVTVRVRVRVVLHCTCRFDGEPSG